MWLNPEPPTFLGLTAPIDSRTIQPCFLKHTLLEEALEVVEAPIRSVLSDMTKYLSKQHRFTLVDVKVKDVASNAYTCIPGWHIDSVTNPRHESSPENHLIWVQGTPTEFVRDPVEFPWELTHFSQVIDEIPIDNAMKLNENSIYRYGRYHLHRGPRVGPRERRILIRVTETDLIRPIPYRKQK